jgi:hypothetical protein
MKKRLGIASGLLVVILGCYLAYDFSRSVPFSSQYPDSYTYNLLFRPGAWIVPIIGFFGIFLRAIQKETVGGSMLKKGKVLRHDEHTFLSHWSHVFAIIILAISGLCMKSKTFIPIYPTL